MFFKNLIRRDIQKAYRDHNNKIEEMEASVNNMYKEMLDGIAFEEEKIHKSNQSEKIETQKREVYQLKKSAAISKIESSM